MVWCLARIYTLHTCDVWLYILGCGTLLRTAANSLAAPLFWIRSIPATDRVSTGAVLWKCAYTHMTKRETGSQRHRWTRDRRESGTQGVRDMGTQRGIEAPVLRAAMRPPTVSEKSSPCPKLRNQAPTNSSCLPTSMSPNSLPRGSSRCSATPLCISPSPPRMGALVGAHRDPMERRHTRRSLLSSACSISTRLALASTASEACVGGAGEGRKGTRRNGCGVNVPPL